MYILNEEKQRVPVEVDVNNNEILVRPPQEGYGKDKTYELFVEKDIKQVDGKILNQSTLLLSQSATRLLKLYFVKIL